MLYRTLLTLSVCSLIELEKMIYIVEIDEARFRFARCKDDVGDLLEKRRGSSKTE